MRDRLVTKTELAFFDVPWLCCFVGLNLICLRKMKFLLLFFLSLTVESVERSSSYLGAEQISDYRKSLKKGSSSNLDEVAYVERRVEMLKAWHREHFFSLGVEGMKQLSRYCEEKENLPEMQKMLVFLSRNTHGSSLDKSLFQYLMQQTSKLLIELLPEKDLLEIQNKKGLFFFFKENGDWARIQNRLKKIYSKRLQDIVDQSSDPNYVFDLQKALALVDPIVLMKIIDISTPWGKYVNSQQSAPN